MTGAHRRPGTRAALMPALAAAAGFAIGRLADARGAQRPRHPGGRCPARAQAARNVDDIARLQAVIADLERTSATELGRLETGAVNALDRVIAVSRTRVEDLTAQLRAARAAAEEANAQLDEQRAISARLAQALADRDDHIARQAEQLRQHARQAAT